MHKNHLGESVINGSEQTKRVWFGRCAVHSGQLWWLTYAHKFLNTPPFERQSLILLPWSAQAALSDLLLTEYGRSLRLGHLSLSWIIHSGVTSCHVKRSLWRDPCGEKPRPPAKSHMSPPFWKQTPQPQPNIQMTTFPASILTANSWENLSKNQPGIPDSPKLWDSKCLVF